jgi:hypothetical protein
VIHLIEKKDHNHVHNHYTLYDEQDVLKINQNKIFISKIFEYIHDALELRQWKTRKCVNKYMEDILLRVHGT